ncbi:uncharacterized protein F4822DRAFT_345383 [Hypoxylon trugodes]|uniref:uncharacterized protein n=1 Tax=Hypoxylon trugodes TaxID=326681 RepID=UPI00219DAA39|nr:uncharacterized protein F4822DRAFT_345383 [Hypoxylon trugodes]KAI1385467.1 hypothetical protein F4822DRAFT_345383 [Hypoxylon trugodes]
MGNVQCRFPWPSYILKLPNELLSEIFALLPHPTKNIASVRLVCRRFRDVSSRHLCPYFVVRMSEESLDCLNNISQHPLISKGVKKLGIDISTFSGMLARNLDELTRVSCNALETAKKPKGSSDEDPRIKEARNKRNKVLHSWLRLRKIGFGGDINDLSDWDRENFVLIDWISKGHLLAHEAQERVRVDGSFVRIIADAIARMPLARSIYISDSNPWDHCASLTETMESSMSLIESTILPMSWSTAHTMGCEGPPIELCSEIPLAIHKAGIMLTGVGYEITCFEGLSGLYGDSGKVLHDITTAMQQLEDFRFDLGYPSFWEFMEAPQENECLCSFLRAFMNTDSIQEMTLMLRRCFKGSFPLVSTWGWPNLRYLKYSGCLDSGDVAKFYERTQGPVELHLDACELVDGFWPEVADIMRANTRSEEGIYPTITDALGGEYGVDPWAWVPVFGDKNRYAEFNETKAWCD